MEENILTFFTYSSSFLSGSNFPRLKFKKPNDGYNEQARKNSSVHTRCHCVTWNVKTFMYVKKIVRKTNFSNALLY